MAFTFDAKAKSTASWANPHTLTFTCGANCKLLVVGVLTRANVPRIGGAPTYNGVALTQAESVQVGEAECTAELWYLSNPATGAAHTISIPNEEDEDEEITALLTVIASSYSNAAAYTAVLDASNATEETQGNPSLAVITTADGAVVVDVFASAYGTPATGNSDVLLYGVDEPIGAWSSHAQYALQTTAGLKTLGYTQADDGVAYILGAFQGLTEEASEVGATVDAILETGGLAVEFQILRYGVDWPEGALLAYVDPPWDAGSEPDLVDEEDITAWVERYSIDWDDGYLVSTATLRLVGDYEERIDRGTAFATTVDAVGSTYIDVVDSMGADDYSAYYAVVTSGVAIGRTFRVESNTATRLTISGRNPALSGLAAGDGIKVSEMTALRAMDVVRIKELWRSLDGSETTALQTIWTGFVDQVGEDLTRGRQYTVNCRDALKLADLDLSALAVEPDRIHVSRKALTLHTDTGGDPSDPVREYGDGAQGSQTTNWCISPVAQLYAVWSDGEERLRKRESIDVVEGEGIVRISAAYWAAEWPDGLTKSGGVGAPTSIQAEYWRYAQAADVVSKAASADIGTDWIGVDNGMTADEHKGKTIIVRSGTAAGKRYVVTVNTATRLYVWEGNPLTDGVADGDLVQVGDANRLEDALRRVLLTVGFQDQQAAKPGYITGLAEPTPGPIYIPPLVYQETRDRTKYLSVLQNILDFAPPNYQLHAGPELNVVGEQFVQADAADWTMTVLSTESRQTSDRDTYTRVLALGQSKLEVNQFARQHGTTVHTYGTMPTRRTRNGSLPTPGNPHVYCDPLALLIDNDARTPLYEGVYGRVWWSYTGTATPTFANNQHLFYIDLKADYTIGEIQLVSPALPYNLKRAMTLTLWVGAEAEVASPGSYNNSNPAEGGWTQLTDEVSPSSSVLTLKADQFLQRTAATFRYLKVFSVNGAFYDNHKTRGGIVLTEMRGYLDRSIVGVAELGTTAPFDTDRHKRLLNRMRRRTFVTPAANPYLDTQEKANDWAKRWLEERYREFAPVSVDGVRPDAAIGQTAALTSLVTGETEMHLVKAVTHRHDGTAQITLVSYA